MEIEFNESEGKCFEDIIKLYLKSKELMLYAEEIGDESFLPATEEFRHAFDHLMRIFGFKLGFKSGDDDYAIKNFNPCYRHLYRAAYNLLDFLSIIFRDKVYGELKGFSGKTLVEIFPKYYHVIKPFIEIDVPEVVSKLRSEKDIGKNSQNDLDKYTEIVERFKSYYEEILRIKPSLIEYEDKKRKAILLRILILIIVTVIGALIAGILL
jgi:hypothetical protein